MAVTRPNGDLHILGTRGDDRLIVLKVDDLSASVRLSVLKVAFRWGCDGCPFRASARARSCLCELFPNLISSEDPLWDVPVAGNAAVRLAHEGIAWLFVPVSPPAGAGEGSEQVREPSPVLPAEADDGQEQVRVARDDRSP